jgi:hypothetical protein
MRALLFIGAVVAMIAAQAGPSQASGNRQHCVVWLTPASTSQRSKVSPMRCYSRFATAQRVASGPAPREFTLATGDAATASTKISIDYDSSGFTGSTLTWTVSDTAGCSDGSTYSAASMPTGWNDRVSSAHSYNGCANNVHYQNSNFLGSAISCTCSSMGTMNNQTSSERWTS